MVVPIVLALVLATTADAAVFCARPKGDGSFNSSVKIREACKPNEVPLGVVVRGLRWSDNGDGTVSDNLTGLVWEKKQDLDSNPNAGNVHDADNIYTLSDG